jgi:hypothetical protein
MTGRKQEMPDQLRVSRVDAPPTPPRPKRPLSPFRQQATTTPTCPLCEKPIGARETMETTAEGALAHARCVTGRKPSKPRRGRRDSNSFAANKARVESGETFRARKPSDWRIGGSPSTAGEIKR